MRIQKLFGVALVLILALGMTGCSLFDRNPAGPINSVGDVSQLGNFWVKDGPGGKYEVSAEDGEMQVSVPSAGQYMLTYTTMNGSFFIVFETLDAATLVIGLQPGDAVDMAYIQEGEILETDGLTAVVDTGILKAYLLPGPDDDDDEADDDDDEVDDDNDEADDDDDDDEADDDDGEADDDDDDDENDVAMAYTMFDGGFMLIMLIVDGDVVLEDADDADDDADDDGEDGDGKWEVTISSTGNGTVKPEGMKVVPDGASISIQFLPDSGMLSDISVSINGADFTGYLQQLGGKAGKQKGHLVIHDVDQDLEVVATFSGAAASGGTPGKKPKK